MSHRRIKIIEANGGPLNVADPVQHAAEEYIAIHQWLDCQGIEAGYDNHPLSLIHRVKLLCKQERHFERMATAYPYKVAIFMFMALAFWLVSKILWR